MTAINGANPYAQYGSAYARAAAAAQPSLADALNVADAGNSSTLDPNAATNLTLSDAAMSDEERQASGWSPSFRDNVVQSYKTTSSILSILQGS